MKAHLAKWFPAYLAGALFLALQFCLALLHVAGALTPAQRAAMTRFDWLVILARVLTVCIPTMLAFLNRSVATIMAQPLPPKEELVAAEDPASAGLRLAMSLRAAGKEAAGEMVARAVGISIQGPPPSELTDRGRA